ncbi:MAG: tRNA pseudouridine(38-40) synthase TruA [Candidatus Baltobacteraceae bacterium]
MAGSAGSRREAGRTPPRSGDRLTTLRLTVEYDGTEFCGFQWQPAARTVAGTLEAALSKLLDEPVKVAGAGRTDSGVHATGQVVSLATGRSFPFERMAAALNSELPADLSIREATIVPEGFSARFAARERTYLYAIFNRRERSAVLARQAYHVPHRIDLAAMRAAAEHLVGERDFRSFCGVLPDAGGTVRCVRRLAIEDAGCLLRVEIAAGGFLHHMVRTIVGTLVDCAGGRRDPGELPAVLAAGDRAAAGPTAPAHGLYLAGVRYDDGYDSFAEPPVFGRGAPALLDGGRAFP